MDSIKVLHIDSGKGWRGGQSQVFLLLRGLEKFNVNSILLSPQNSPLVKKAQQINIKTIPLSLKGEWDIFSAYNICKIVKQESINIIHAHDARSHSLAWLSSIFSNKIPIVVTRRVDFDISKNFLSQKKYCSSNIRYIAISNGVKDILIKGGVNPNKISIAHSGIDLNKFNKIKNQAPINRSNFTYPSNWNINEKNIVVGNVASLSDHKGHKYLIEAAAKVIEKRNDVRFVIVGEGDERKNLEQLITRLNLQNFVFLAGFQENVDAWFQIFDLFVISSHLEGLCTSLLDAMLFEIPSIGTDVGGIPDIIINEKTGLLVPPKDPISLSEAILRLISDEQMSKQLSFNALKKVKENFSAEKMVEDTLKIYKLILEERNK